MDEAVVRQKVMDALSHLSRADELKEYFGLEGNEPKQAPAEAIANRFVLEALQEGRSEDPETREELLVMSGRLACSMKVDASLLRDLRKSSKVNDKTTSPGKVPVSASPNGASRYVKLVRE